ncbi:MAG: hypothetical protein JWO80_5156 [Bryobacterales bacterium]|nr:hypothetical protein [Bryobacterales bacterium]
MYKRHLGIREKLLLIKALERSAELDAADARHVLDRKAGVPDTMATALARQLQSESEAALKMILDLHKAEAIILDSEDTTGKV